MAERIIEADGVPVFTLRELSDEEVRVLYRERMQHDFPKGELKKLDMMLDLKSRGKYLTRGVFDRDKAVGYAFFSMISQKTEECLLDYFSVYKAFRGKGIGSELLSVIAGELSSKKVIMCEVEDPFMAEEGPEREFRKKRMEFYLRHNWYDTGLSVYMYSVDYRILAAPTGVKAGYDEILSYYRNLYIDIVGTEELEENMKINHPESA